MASRPGHDINAGTAAEYFTHAQRNRAAIEVGIGLGYEGPVAFRTKVHCPLCWVYDLGNIIASTCFEQAYTDLRISRATAEPEGPDP